MEPGLIGWEEEQTGEQVRVIAAEPQWSPA